jgi:thioredoxin reductase
MNIIYNDNIIIGAGPAGLQLAYFFQKNSIDYIILEKGESCATFFSKFPHSSQLISINKKFTGNSNPEFNLRHDWNSLLNDEGHLFKKYTDEYYPDSMYMYKYLNDFYKNNNFNIKFNTTVKIIDKNITENSDYKYILTIDKKENIKYYCKKLIIATGLSEPNIPKYSIKVEKKIYHYADFGEKFFQQTENLKKYENKRLLIIGGGNSSYELANILNKYCSSILILESNKDKSIVSHYAGDLRSINYPFLDTFYLKSLNAIDTLDAASRNDITITNNINGKKYEDKFILKINGKNYYNNDSNIFDEVIYCTGWKFNNKIFNFDIALSIENKYPNTKYNYESVNNIDLYFIGSLMHIHDFKKSSGGFIHGFRYLIKFFTQINYNLNLDKKIFKFNGNLHCYSELCEHIMYRMNNSSSLYQMYGIMCDIFYYDKLKKEIIYIQDLTLDYVINQFANIPYVNVLQLNYGNKVYDIRQIGGFKKFDPIFLHPEIIILEHDNGKLDFKDKIILEEELFANFSSKEHKDKLLRTLKGCPLIL